MVCLLSEAMAAYAPQLRLAPLLLLQNNLLTTCKLSSSFPQQWLPTIQRCGARALVAACCCCFCFEARLDNHPRLFFHSGHRPSKTATYAMLRGLLSALLLLLLLLL